MRPTVYAALALAVCAACGSDGGPPAASPTPVTSSAAPTSVASPKGTSAPLPEVPTTGCGRVVETLGLANDHLQPGTRHSYPTFPPLGGSHDPSPLPAGWRHGPLVDDPSGAGTESLVRFVHSLEHGYIGMFYEDSVTPDQLTDVHTPASNGGKFIVAPAGRKMAAPIAMVAWEHRMWCATVDVDRMLDFVKKYRGAGGTAPEPNAR